MPIYVYRCPKCDRVEELQRPIAFRDLDLPVCPTCVEAPGVPRQPVTMARIVTAPAGTFPGAASWRG